MSSRQPLLHVLEYSKSTLEGLLDTGVSVEYLHRYLTDLGVRSILHEEHYIDRHFRDDYAHYYARSFDSPDTTCQRVHFFAGSLAEDIENSFREVYACQSDWCRIEGNLQHSYVGFVVRRPLAGARIGRTVLKTYPVAKRRLYGVVRPHRVHVAGLELRVEGLAYQQQDRGAAVCASTALWSALQRVSYMTGHRTPTPHEITRAAKSPFPASHGLEDSQMAEAISALGYDADQFSPEGNRRLFRAKLAACIRSQLPVVLLMTMKEKTRAGDRTVGHAVTVTGYSEPNKVEGVEVEDSVAPLPMRSASLKTLYVHDDNLGSHAHYELEDSDGIDTEGRPKLCVYRGCRSKTVIQGWTPDTWDVEKALVPKPDKLRFPIEDLLSSLVWLRPWAELPFEKLPLNYDVRFVSGVSYRRSLLTRGLAPDQMEAFQRTLTLPRYVAVLSAYTENNTDESLFDILIDASEVARDPNDPSVLAIVAPGVPSMSIAWKHQKQLIDRDSRTLYISAPPTTA